MFLSVTISLFLITIWLWLRWRKKKMSFFKNLGIPGPDPSIFFGNLQEYRKKDPNVCHKEWIETYGKVLGFYFGSMPVLLVADIELLKQIQIKESSNFINRPEVLETGIFRLRSIFKHHIAELQGQRWKEVRSTMTPAFTSGKMKLMLPMMDECVSNLLQRVSGFSERHESFDLCLLFQELTIAVIGKTALGIQGTNKSLLDTARLIFRIKMGSLLYLFGFSFREFHIIVGRILKVMMTVLFGGKFPLFELADACQDVVTARRNDPSLHRPDLLQGLIEAERLQDGSAITDQELTATQDIETAPKEGTKNGTDTSKGGASKVVRLTDEEVVANALIVMLAGFETTSSALSFTAHFLVNHLDVQTKCQEEIDAIFEEEGDIQYSSLHKMTYLDQVFNESLRMCPPIYQFVFRQSVHEATVGSWTIPAQTAVFVPVYYLHHDPDLWPDPETFDPSRFSAERRREIQTGSFQAFGAGPRNCIGMRFAQMESKLALARLLRNFSLRSCSETHKGNPEFTFSPISLGPKPGVHVKAIPR